ncbi:RNA-associated protein 6 homolog [Seminavis robusta]|uniref:RNA-associated protein 6 homolog n=1 Tax=Seminavis robusta TaxID=568900 RepID=A0A9N8ECS5_9STRA|nr:RNA-associated protein 6 homolog [Seminavis robusta]|eukprot:Sro757_g197930.1 RNA-associated protein 6 homolog (756) ;mRNA; f:16261-18528
MAEQVQAALDKMVPPLADLMDRNIFSQEEIHAIVARRRNSEYLLRRTSPRKADFLKYIQDELQLERLRLLRTKRIQKEQKQRLLQKQEQQQQVPGEEDKVIREHHIGDAHIIQHIHLLFKRALQRYNREDVSMYLQYADVAKELGSFQKLPQIYAQAVQLHPHATGVWIEAASHEFFHRTSVSTARILLQRALRINPKAQDLWFQSFALEFHYIAKMKGRQSVLLKQSATTTTTTIQDNPSLDSTLFVVAKIVYDKAIEAIPNDIDLRLGFLDLCKSFPHTLAMEEYIFKSIRNDFKETPKAWIARATRLLHKQLEQKQQQNNEDKDMPKGFLEPLQVEETDQSESEDNDSSSSNSSGDDDDDDRPAKKQKSSEPHKKESKETDAVLAMIQKALQAVPTTEMYLKAVQFLWMYCERIERILSSAAATDEEDASSAAEATRERILLEFFPNLFQQALTTRPHVVYNSSLALQHAEYHVRLEQPENARQVLADFCASFNKGNKKNAQQLPSTKVWIALANLTFQVNKEQQSAIETRKVIKEAMSHFPVGQKDHMQLLLQLLGVELVMVRQQSARDADIDNTHNNSKECKMVMATFQKILLLASNRVSPLDGGEGDTAEDDDDESLLLLTSESSAFGITSMEDACLQFLIFAVEAYGPLEGVRKASKLVLLQSNFLQHWDAKQATNDLDRLVAFFDKCLEVEMDTLRNNKTKAQLSKAERKKGRVALRELCKAAIQTFQDVPALAKQYQQMQHDALLL